MLSYCRFSLSHFEFTFKNSLSLRGNLCNMIMNTGVNDQLHCIYGTYDIFHSIFCRWKRNKYRYTYWAGWSPVLYRQPSPNHHNRRNRQHRTPSLCYCEHRNINRRVCINIFQHNISFINRQVQATLVSENKTYQKHFFLNSCKFVDRNLIYYIYYWIP